MVPSRRARYERGFVAGREPMVGQLGPRNRKPRNDYKVIFVFVADGARSRAPLDVLTGLINQGGEALGRPVASRSTRSPLESDDLETTDWRISAATPPAS